jgi:hypothetical protein
MGLDIGVGIYWGVAYSCHDLETYAEGGLGNLPECLSQEALKKLVKFWDTKDGRKRRRNLQARLQTYYNLLMGQPPDENDEITAPVVDFEGIWAASGCKEIGVYRYGIDRDYGDDCEGPTFIVGFEAFSERILNPHCFDPSELSIGEVWQEEIRRFTAHEGLPYDDSEHGGSDFAPNWLMCASMF